MKVETRAIVEIEKDRDAVWAHCSQIENIPKIVRGLGPIPGVDRAWNLGGGPSKVGVVRRLVMSDGVPLDEELTAFEPPRKFAYTIRGFRGAFGLLVSRAEGLWIFSPLGNGTRISWTFSAVATSPLVMGVLLPLIKVFMKRSMEAALQNAKQQLEA